MPWNMRKMHKYYQVHAQSIILSFALNSYILQYPMILLADSEEPDQTAQVHGLIWAFAVSIIIWLKTFWHGGPIFLWVTVM